MNTDEQNRVSGANCGGGGGGSLSGSGSDIPSAAIISQPVPSSYVAYGGNYGAPASTVGGGSGGGGGGAGANSPGPVAPRGADRQVVLVNHSLQYHLLIAQIFQLCHQVG